MIGLRKSAKHTVMITSEGSGDGSKTMKVSFLRMGPNFNFFNQLPTQEHVTKALICKLMKFLDVSDAVSL